MICKHWNVRAVGLNREMLVCRQRKTAMFLDESEVYCKTCPSREDA